MAGFECSLRELHNIQRVRGAPNGWEAVLLQRPIGCQSFRMYGVLPECGRLRATRVEQAPYQLRLLP